MSSFSDTVENEVLNHLFGSTTYAKPANVYVTVTTSATGLEIDDAASMDEPSAADGMVRQLWSAADATAGSMVNDSLIAFPNAVNNGWGTITHIVLMDSATVGAGSVLGWALMDASVSIPSPGATLQFQAGTVSVSAS